MAFRRRNYVIRASGPFPGFGVKEPQVPEGRKLKTSTGTASLDRILSSQRGLPFGTSLLVEETGTTDYGGLLSRYFAAEGLVQGHAIHFHGPGDIGQHLPGLVEEKRTQEATPLNFQDDTNMRIAWRYRNTNPLTMGMIPSTPILSRDFTRNNQLTSPIQVLKALPTAIPNHFVTHSTCQDAWARLLCEATFTPHVLMQFLSATESRLRHSTPLSQHRILIPSLLSPSQYRPDSVEPQGLLQLIHGIRSLLRQFPTRAVALVTIPRSLYSRSSGLIKWVEILFDGTIEIDTDSSSVFSEYDGGQQQGVVRVHSLPVVHERGGGREGTSLEQMMLLKTCVVSGVHIQPSDLPPVISGEHHQSFDSNLSLEF
ncbi:hypothetical protein CP532_3768 [Ophiocordyceps camponoti-leonardi (nom. inval.)]|nr:hypothetical protein CP532_3768 [Ophiocordyceps camponoti-leonardi (nom. inval.)]